MSIYLHCGKAFLQTLQSTMQIGKELGGGHQGAVYELLDGKGKDSGQVLKVRTVFVMPTSTGSQLLVSFSIGIPVALSLSDLCSA